MLSYDPQHLYGLINLVDSGRHRLRASKVVHLPSTIGLYLHRLIWTDHMLTDLSSPSETLEVCRSFWIIKLACWTSRLICYKRHASRLRWPCTARATYHPRSSLFLTTLQAFRLSAMPQVDVCVSSMIFIRRQKSRIARSGTDEQGILNIL